MTSVTKNLISDRYKFTGTSILALSDLQIAKRNLVQTNISEGLYKQEYFPCPVCDSNSFELIAEQDRYGLPVSTVICDVCDLVQTNPRMREQDYSDFYSNHYRELYRGHKHATTQLYEDARSKAEGVLAYVKKLVNPDNNKKPSVLDVGCGSGALLEVFRDAGFRTVGIDYGEDYQNIGKTKGLDVRKATIFDLEQSIQPDIIIYNHVFEHVLDLNKELMQISGMLEDGGYVYIQVPGIKDLGSNYSSDFLRSLQNAHLYHFTLSTLGHIMEKHGFQLVRGNEYIHSLWQKSGNKISGIGMTKTPGSSRKIIEKAERRRRVYALTKTVLKKIGVFEMTKNLVKKITSRPAR